MAFRTVVIDSHSKLEYSLNYLVYRTPEKVRRLLLDEIHTLIIQSTAVSLTTSLISELCKRKIKVIFCDERSEPSCELMPYFCAHNNSGRIFEQISWTKDSKGIMWKRIVEEKIKNQAKSLYRKGKFEEANMLFEYGREVQIDDISNREGHAAKVYFNSIYFKGSTRDRDCDLNKYLNYGYTILLAAFNRSVVSSGYLTQIGIHHKNDFNPFNISCDLIEPFRFIIDDFVESIAPDIDWKGSLLELLNKEYEIAGKSQNLFNAIALYCQSVFSALSGKGESEIRFLLNEI